MKTKTFTGAIEQAIRQMYDQEVNFESLPYMHKNGGDEPEMGECLGIVIPKPWHFATITARAAAVLVKAAADEGFTESDMSEILDDFADLVTHMRVAPYMQWIAIYFPGLTEEQVLGSTEAFYDPDLVTDTEVGRDPITGLMDFDPSAGPTTN